MAAMTLAMELRPEQRAEPNLFPAWLRKQFTRQECTAKEFCAKHGLNGRTINYYLAGRTPARGALRAIAEATGETLPEVLRLAGYVTQDDLDIYVRDAIDTGRYDRYCRARFEPAA